MLQVTTDISNRKFINNDNNILVVCLIKVPEHRYTSASSEISWWRLCAWLSARSHYLGSHYFSEPSTEANQLFLYPKSQVAVEHYHWRRSKTPALGHAWGTPFLLWRDSLRRLANFGSFVTSWGFGGFKFKIRWVLSVNWSGRC